MKVLTTAFEIILGKGRIEDDDKKNDKMSFHKCF